jgi:hypothetical protein
MTYIIQEEGDAKMGSVNGTVHVVALHSVLYNAWPIVRHVQYYHSGRDLLEFERNLESFKGFGKPIHITELGISSSADIAEDSEWWGGGAGGAKMVWRGERFSEENQAQWVEAVYKIAFSKSYVGAITWWDLMDPGFIPNGGYLRADLTPKLSYGRLLALQTKWREEGILPARR